MKKLDIVIFGLSITSSWGNGHATTYRSLVRALSARGHRITFVERDVPWYAANRDLPHPDYCRVVLYRSIEELQTLQPLVARADLVVLGSYVADADRLCTFVKAAAPACFAFYDIDTPVTLAKLARGDYEYLRPWMIPEFDIFLSFSGGPILDELEKQHGARRALPLFCSVDTELYFPERAGDADSRRPECILGYLGSYSDDRQPTLRKFLIDTANKRPKERFCVAGAKYPETIDWPGNVQCIGHIPPHRHRRFYNAQRFTLNVTRRDMIDAGYSPSVRLFEAGAAGTPVITDYWDGLDYFFAPDEEILVAKNTADVLRYLALDDSEREAIGRRFRERILAGHTSGHRAMEIERYWQQATAPTVVAHQQASPG